MTFSFLCVKCTKLMENFNLSSKYFLFRAMVSGLSRKVSAWENFFSGEYLQIFYILAVLPPLTPWKTNFATDIVELH